MISQDSLSRERSEEGDDTTHGSTSGVRLLARVGAILSVLEQYDGSVSLGTIARTTGLNKATVHRILAGLIDLRLVERGPAPATYQLGIWAFRLGASVQRRLDVRARALPHLSHLNAVTEDTTYLCVRDGASVLCIERMEGKHVAALRLKLGGSLPLNAGAASRVFLASLSDTELHQFLKGELPQLTPKTMTDRAALLADVHRTQEQGYVLSEEDVTDGVCAIGSPVFDAHGSVVAALSISGVLPRFCGPRRSQLIGLVKDTARAISMDLGYLPEAPLPFSSEKTS